MGPLTKKQKRAREQLKNSTEDDFEILAALEVEEAPEVDDEVIEEDLKPSFPIKWKDSEATTSRAKYWGTSRTVKYYYE